jgi:outer membrane biogenesis lipoprotein LolB
MMNTPVPYRRCPVMLYASLSVLAGILALLLLAGCSFSMTVGTGNRTASTFTTHSQIPETLKEIAPIAESASRGAVRGLNPAP